MRLNQANEVYQKINDLALSLRDGESIFVLMDISPDDEDIAAEPERFPERPEGGIGFVNHCVICGTHESFAPMIVKAAGENVNILPPLAEGVCLAAKIPTKLVKKIYKRIRLHVDLSAGDDAMERKFATVKEYSEKVINTMLRGYGVDTHEIQITFVPVEQVIENSLRDGEGEE